MSSFEWYPATLALATVLGTHGYLKGSLSLSGGIAAAVLGYAHLANPDRTFGVLLLVFYFLGSRATKVKADVKAKLEREEEHDQNKKAGAAAAHKAKSGGRRNAWQVLCNALLSGLAAVIYRVNFSQEPILASLQSNWHFLGKTWGAVDTCTLLSTPGLPQSFSAQMGKLSLLISLGHYAACMGDVLASELGILSSSPPRLITNPARVVPPGTNGGVSAFGTLCSALGGLIIGGAFVASESFRCSGFDLRLAASYVALGTFGGFAGSGIDSLLGATMQRTWYSTKSKQVLLGSRHLRNSGIEDDDWTVITGHDILNNNAVNIISATLGASLIAFVGCTLL